MTISKKRMKRFLFGTVEEDGFLTKILLYTILVGISFIFLYPLLQMIVKSFMSLEDLIDPSIKWLPSTLVVSNYTKAIEVLKFGDALKDSIIVSLVPTICAVISSMLIAYGFAHFKFPGKNILFGILIFVFLIPTVLLSIPTYVMYNNLNMLGSLKAYFLPALTGFGLRQPVFIFIFYQFFSQIPHELSESAEVDGANELQVFIKIAIPTAVQAIIICTLYSFVWYWNETSLANSYLKDSYTTLQIAVSKFENIYKQLFPAGNVGIDSASQSFNESVLFAGTMLSILPLLVLYAFTQKWFVESADRAGIAGN